MFSRLKGGLVCGMVGIAALASSQLRVATYNISNYAGGKVPSIQTAFYSVFNTRQFAPDAIVCQEFLSATALTEFRNALNTAPGSPGDWVAATFINGADTDGVFLYRTSKVQYLGTTVVSTGSSASTNHPRNLLRHDFRPVGYTSASNTIYYYNTHMKAGSTQLDMDRRLVEAEEVRLDAENLPAGSNFLLGGDFNIGASTETAYQHLVSSQINNNGRLFDPINRPGNWGLSSFATIHTQDPSGSGGMDDRYDQILISSGLFNSSNIDYIGNPAVAFSGSTWNDPNHSYRCWGNDGLSYNTTLRTSTNTMVGEAIALALIDLADTSGHLPVYMDLKLPAKINAPTVIDFGKTMQGMKPIARTLNVSHGGNVALWNAAGLQNLSYSLSVPTGFTGPTGPFVATPGGSNAHTLVMDTSTPGFRSMVLTIASNDPDFPVKTVILQGYVIGRRGGNGVLP